MTFSQSTYHSKIYRDFKDIDASAYRTITRFYEEREEDIQQLEFGEYFELLHAYTSALFEIGAYRKHLLMADVVIEISILQNIHQFQGKDVYCDMLFKKAASHYNLLEYDQAEHILRELIKINPSDLDTVAFLKKCLRRQRPRYVKGTRAVAVLLFLLTAVVIALDILVIRHFYTLYESTADLIRNGLFVTAWLVLIAGDLWLRWQVERQVNLFVEEIKMRKQTST